jgi:iron complex transport system substrate-binding protein
MTLEQLAKETVNAAFRVYHEVGPGLLESVYEAALSDYLTQRGFQVQCRVPVPMVMGDRTFDVAFRADLLVERRLLVELKSLETLLPVHGKQTLTYLRLMNLHLGLLINFGAPTFRNSVRRIVLNHRDTTGSDLRLHRD